MNRLYPHQTESESGAPPVIHIHHPALPDGGKPGQVLTLDKRGELYWADPSIPADERPSGLIDPSTIPPLGASHIPNLSGTYQVVDDKDVPGGYAGLDSNGKLSAYAIPVLARGLQGDRGPVGPPGPQGSQGNQGRPGDTGLQGPRGFEGGVGPAGPAGARGAAPDMDNYVKAPASTPLLSLQSETLARDVAYFLAELGLVRLI